MTLAGSNERELETSARHPAMGATACAEITSLLQQVSRSFYLTLRVLPLKVRPQVGLAYLLARASDTVADTEIVPVQDRLAMLAALRDRISGSTTRPLNFERFAGAAQSGFHKTSRSTASAERAVLVRIEEFLGCLAKLSEPDRELVRGVLSTIISGQELDLRRFGAAGPDQIIALGSGEELDDYTYRVAGCVGEFWTRICRAHLFPKAKLDERSLFENGIRFGKGLQLVNVLRDLPADLRQGRCYLPNDRLQKLGLDPKDLLKTDSYGRLKPLYYELLTLAETYLAAGWEYTNTLPRRCIRLRLACAWPVLIGTMTLRKLHTFNVLDETQRVKVSRSEVRRIMAGTIIGQFVPFIWRRLFARAKLV